MSMVVQYTGHTHALVCSRDMGTTTACERLDKHGKFTNYNAVSQELGMVIEALSYAMTVHWILGITYTSLCMVGSSLIYGLGRVMH